jgi:hypothetical protein
MENAVIIVDDNEKEIVLKKFGFECYSTNGQIQSVIGFKTPEELHFQLKEDYEWLQKKIQNKTIYFAMSKTIAGENIAFDMYNLLNTTEEKHRIYLSSIATRECVLESIKNVLPVRKEFVEDYQNLNLENYRFAFTISPILWKCMSNTYEKKLTINKSQFEVLQKLVEKKHFPVKYKLKGYFSKKYNCFECLTTFDTFDQVKEAGEKIKNVKPILLDECFTNNKPLTLKRLLEEFGTTTTMSLKDVFDCLKTLYYKGFICEINDVDMICTTSKTFDDNGISKNERLLYKYILKNIPLNQSKSLWQIQLADYIFIGEIKPLLLTLNGLRTEISANKNVFFDEENLRALDYKGFINITRKSTVPVEYVEMDFFTGTREIKTIAIPPCLLEPLGYMVFQFIVLKDYERKFEIKIDEKHSCIVGKYGLVVRNNETSTFLKMKENYDYEGMFLQKSKVEDVAIIINSSSTTKKEYIFFEGKEVVLKKGKYGLYAQLGGKKNVSLKELGNRPIENIKKEEVLNILEKSLKNNY